MKQNPELRTTHQTDCPICNSPTSLTFPAPPADIYSCERCSHSFTDPTTIPAEPYGADYYELTHRNWFNNPNYSLFDRIANLVRESGPGTSILDVGCGRGGLLSYIRTRNDSARLEGIELSEIPPSPGIRYHQSDVFDWCVEKPFDMVVTLAVIEHVADVSAFIQKLGSFTKKGGKLIIMTLNANSILYRTARLARTCTWTTPFDRLYSSHHLHHFTKSSLKALLTSNGLTISSHFTHNIPLAAVDFASKGRLMDAIQMAGVATCFTLGTLTNQGYLQTVVCEKS